MSKSKSDRLEEAHNKGQEDAATSESVALLGETNYHPPGNAFLESEEGSAEREAYIKGFDHGKEQQEESSRVICTHFYRKGMLSREVWRADMAFTAKHISETTVRGYHCWAIPYVQLMRKSSFAERIMFPVARWRAEELAYQMGKLPQGNFKGKMVRLVIEPLCWTLGLFVHQKDWQVLEVVNKT